MDVWCRKCRKKTKGKQKVGLFGGNKIVCGECGEEDEIKPVEERKMDTFKGLLKGLLPIGEKDVTPEELHNLYLDKSKELDPDNFNPEAQVPFDELPEPQKKLDKAIADELNAKAKDV